MYRCRGWLFKYLKPQCAVLGLLTLQIGIPSPDRWRDSVENLIESVTITLYKQRTDWLLVFLTDFSTSGTETFNVVIQLPMVFSRTTFMHEQTFEHTFFKHNSSYTILPFALKFNPNTVTCQISSLTL